MPTLAHLRAIETLPPSYREAIHGRARWESRYAGPRLTAEAILQHLGDPVALERDDEAAARTARSAAASRTAALISDLRRLKAELKEACRGRIATGRLKFRRQAAEIEKQLPGLREQVADAHAKLMALEAAETKDAMARRVALRRRIAYARNYAKLADEIIHAVKLDLLPLLGGDQKALAALAKKRRAIVLELLGGEEHAITRKSLSVQQRRKRDAERLRRTDLPRIRRKLRREVNQACMHVGNLLGLVGEKHPYASNASVQLSKEQNDRMDAWAEAHALVHKQTREAVPMTDIIRKSVARRFATLWSLSKSVEQWAEQEGFEVLFITMTVPAVFHSNPTKGRDRWDRKLSIIDGVNELQHRWRSLRELARQAGIQQVGIWTLEPHQDGTPHRHAMIFVRPEQVEDLVCIFRRLFPESGKKLSKEERKRLRAAPVVIEGGTACNVKRWERRDGGASPASYIIKYIAKHLPGGDELVEFHYQAVADDEERREHLENRARVEAWRRALGGKRAYGFFGLVPGTVGAWALIAKLAKDHEALSDPTFGGAHRAIKDRRGADALRLLGAINPLPQLDADSHAADDTGAAWWVGQASMRTGYGDFQTRGLRLISAGDAVIERSSGMWAVQERAAPTETAPVPVEKVA